MTVKLLLSQLAQTSVLVVGDIMLDETVWGDVRRISPEAPVPIVEAKRRTYAPGGAGNVAANVVSVGGTAHLGGLVGEDSSAVQLRNVLESCGVQATGLTPDASRPTTTKTRIMAHSQQVVRVDSEARSPMLLPQSQSLLEWVEANLTGVGAVVLSDYSKGVVTPDFAQAVMQSAQRVGKPVIVDPKGTEYTLCLIRLIKPSYETRNRLLSEPSPCSIITSLGAWLLIIQSFTFLPLDSAINRVPHNCFQK